MYHADKKKKKGKGGKRRKGKIGGGKTNGK